MKRIIVLGAILLLLFSLSAQNKVIKLPPDSGLLPQTNGFFYMLPQTVFKIDVTVTRTNLIKGYYTDYAEKLLGLSNVISTNATSYTLNDISISPYIVPDSQEVYYVELTSKQVKKNFLSTLYQNATPYKEDVFSNKYSNIITQLPDFFKNYSEITYVEKEDTYVETQIIEGVVTEVPVSKTKIITKSIEQKAQEAADFIIQIRKDKYDLTAGAQEVPYSKEALALMINELNQWEKNYLDLFTGITLETQLNYSFLIIPHGCNDTLIPLFSLDPLTGFHQSLSRTNPEQNYYMKLVPQFSHDQWENFLNQKQKEEKYIANNGYRIRKATPAVISLLHNKNSVHLWGIYPIYQFGKIETLPNKIDYFDITSYIFIY